jgi:hypothetical protein
VSEATTDGSGLVYSAGTRCRCGAGLCYDEALLRKIHEAFKRQDMPEEEQELWRNRDIAAKAWWCERLLREQIDLAPETTDEDRAKGAPPGWANGMAGAAKDATGQVHDIYPFWCYEIKSENQPSANGATTRPGGAL